jgi:uncharacterized protein (DUF1501 family)
MALKKDTAMPIRRWWSCDGRGHVADLPIASAERRYLTRRQALAGSAAAALAAWAGQNSALAGATFTPEAADPNASRAAQTLVVIFLRGGADGLSLVPPYGEDLYHRLRPTIGLRGAKDAGAKADARCLDLDGFFGLHPSLSALHPLFSDGRLAIVHAVGSQDHTLSHFEAMAAMERGMPDSAHLAGSAGAAGWLARYLSAQDATRPVAPPSPLRAVAWGDVLPDSLRGATDTTVLTTLADYRLDTAAHPLAGTLAALYAPATPVDDPIRAAGRETLHVLDVLRRIDPTRYQPSNGAVYPKGDLSDGLRQVACLVRARVGLEVACLDHRGPYLWDTHVAQQAALPSQAKDLGDAIAAFANDLGRDGLRDVAVIAMTEFGRRAQENSGLGTDHGRGSVLFALGGPIRGGKVYSAWPGLRDDQLEPPGDLRVTTDYRRVLAEVVSGLRGPGYTAKGLFPGLPDGAPIGLA